MAKRIGFKTKVLRSLAAAVVRNDRLRNLASRMVEMFGRELGYSEASYYDEIFLRFKEFTRIQRPAFVANLKLVDQFRHVEGSVVECGVWRGGMCAGLAALLGSERRYFLYDSFEGLPEAQKIDGSAAAEWQVKNSVGNCKTEKDYAVQAMRRSGAKNFDVVAGWFEKTLPEFPDGEKIAILRLDADWYSSTAECLNYLYGRVVEGGLIIFDDYFTWDGCSRAVHAFLAANVSNERIREVSPRIAYIVKSSRPVVIQIDPYPDDKSSQNKSATDISDDVKKN